MPPVAANLLVITESERQKGIRKVVVLTAGKTTRSGRVRTFFIIDPKTGQRTGATRSAGNIKISSLGGGGFEGEKFVTVPAPDVQLRRILERQEAVRERKAGERAEAEQELKRRERGLPPLPVTKAARTILTKLLQEKAQKELRERLKAPTTRAEFQRELFRKQRIAATLEKQAEVARKVARPKKIVPISDLKPQPIKFLDIETAIGVQAEQITKPIQQTKIVQELPDLSRLILKEPIGTIEIARPFPPGLITKERELIGFFAGKELRETKDPLKKLQITLRTTEEIGQAFEKEGDRLAGLGLIFLGTTARTVFEVSPLGIGLSIKERGFQETLESFNPANLIRAVKEGELLRTTTPSARAIELFGLGTGAVLGGRVTQLTVKKTVVKPLQIVTKKLFERKIRLRPGQIGGPFVADQLIGKELKFREVRDPLTGRVIQKGGELRPKVDRGLPVIEKVTGAVISERQLQLAPKGFDVLKEFEPPRVGKGIVPKPTKLSKFLKLEERVRLETFLEGKPTFGKLTETGRVVSVVRPTKQLRLVETLKADIFKPTEFGKQVLVSTKTIDISRFGSLVDVLKTPEVKGFRPPKVKVRVKQPLFVLEPVSATILAGQEAFFDVFDTLRSNIELPGIKEVIKPTGLIRPRPGLRLIFPPRVDVFEEFDIGREEVFIPDVRRRRRREFDIDVRRKEKQRRELLITPVAKLETIQDIFEEFDRGRERIFEEAQDVVQIPERIQEKVQERELIIPLVPVTEQVTELEVTTKRPRIIEPPRPPPKVPPTEPLKPLISLPRKKPKEIKKGRFEGYNAFVKGRKGRQLKVNLRRTLTKQSALSSSARVVDNSIAATGSIKKVISNKPPLDTKDFYFQRNRDKFRTFQIRKGKRIPLKDKFIEKRGKRLDTRGEVLQITAAKKIAEQRRRLARLDVFGTQPKSRRKRTVRFF